MMVVGLVALAVAAAGCGSSGSSSSSSPATGGGTHNAGAAGGGVSGGAGGGGGSGGGSASGGGTGAPGALSAEARSAGTGDIPDTQVFLAFQDAAYTVKYPEGWTQKGSGADVTFSDKNNVVHLVLRPGGAPSVASVTAELTRLRASAPTLRFRVPKAVHLTAGTGIKSTYTTRSTPSPVTGKSVTLIVDRYELARDGKRMTVDLGTAVGVDNVDAYRMIINSFAWR